MEFTLKDYQVDAAAEILDKLKFAGRDWHERGRRTAFALSSTTGSGKTVIAATVIEALLHGSDEFDFAADPSAVVLWMSKAPALNEQTISRFRACADQIPTGDLVLLDKNYAEDSLATGKVYFINPAKLAKTSDFVKHTDSRHFTFWEILAKTVDDEDKTLYLVLDEAHEGMKAPSGDDQTIVQKIINGNGANPPMPVVWGISATVKRFDEAMKHSTRFSKEPNVEIDPKRVQASGLLKNTLTLDIPDEDGDFSTTMVREATLDFVTVCETWADCLAEHAGQARARDQPSTKPDSLSTWTRVHAREHGAYGAEGPTESNSVLQDVQCRKLPPQVCGGTEVGGCHYTPKLAVRFDDAG